MVNKEMIAGSFLVGGLVLLFFMAFTLGTKEGILQHKVDIDVMFDDINGLAKGNAVTMLGVYVGSVSGIQVVQADGQYKVRASLSIYERYFSKLRNDAVFKIQVDGLMGPKSVTIDPGVTNESLDPKKLQSGMPPIDIEDIAKSGQDALNSLNSTLQAAEGDLEDLHYISKTMKRLLDRVERKLIEGSLFKIF
jgi:ABC-type transporter Mla subunit MlaD